MWLCGWGNYKQPQKIISQNWTPLSFELPLTTDTSHLQYQTSTGFKGHTGKDTWKRKVMYYDKDEGGINNGQGHIFCERGKAKGIFNEGPDTGLHISPE